MAISDIYSSGEHKRNLGHFASIVKMAKVDDVISEGEQKLLDRAARRLNITDEEYKEVLKNPEKHPINPPIGYNASIERLYRLAKMIYADDTPNKEEVDLLKKIATGLTFKTEMIDAIVSEAVHLIMNDNDLEDFTKAIKAVNS
ncbi:MAG TPA: TerB family tellurite resistance protein [Flavobacteriaceae bacterium]|nr:TerB family tellurite resistance protein [Flavobacteriaceae bacterium]